MSTSRIVVGAFASAVMALCCVAPAALIRIYAQESNCFIVVERGKGMQNLQQERALGASGEL